MRGPRVALVAVLVLVAAVVGVARTGESAAEDSSGQSRLAELRERLAPELVRELDQAGRFVPLERLAARGALDALERPTQTDAPNALDAPDAEETPRRAEPDDFIPPQRPFDIDQFEANIRDALDGLTVGYAYSIWQAGSLHSEDGVGKARINPDAPETDQSATKAMTVASISKTITAVAVLRVLQQEGISVDAAIGPWLPSAWEPGEGVADITFRQLMTHRSGLLQNYQTATGISGGVSTGSWDNIKIAIEQDLGSQTYRYANMNFSIFRIMLPKIAYGLDWSHYYHKPPPGVTSAHYDTLTGIIFEDYVQNLMAKAGAAIGCSSVDPIPTRLYAFPTNGAAGWGPESYITSCGGFGYYVSANGIAAILSYLRYTSELVSAETRALMYDGELGIDEYTGDHGTYLGHGAVWAKGSKGMRGCAMSFHTEVDVALLVNSRGDYPAACNVVENAFDAAWT